MDLRRSSGRVTIYMILSNVVLYLVFSYGSFFLYIDPVIIERYGFQPILLNSLEGFIRIFTSMFLHATIFHLFFNMFALYYFGREIESDIGGLRFLILYILSGFSAALYYAALSFYNPSDLFSYAVGASGAISGVLGAFMMMRPKTAVTVCFFIPIPICGSFSASMFLVVWLGIQVILGFIGGGPIAFFAHVGGFLSGISLSYLLARQTARTFREYIFYGLAGGCSGLPTLSKVISLLLLLSLLVYIPLSIYREYQFIEKILSYLPLEYISTTFLSLLLTLSALYIVLFKDQEIDLDC
ncbi:MAG: rhomboid family intramembrane serine protease [Sulfolobales archaeon]